MKLKTDWMTSQWALALGSHVFFDDLLFLMTYSREGESDGWFQTMSALYENTEQRFRQNMRATLLDTVMCQPAGRSSVVGCLEERGSVVQQYRHRQT